jgi:hypothetical protein
MQNQGRTTIMTDRYNAFIVVLEHDLRDDDAESTIEAIKHIRGVLSVKPRVANMGELIAEERIRHELGQKLWHVLYPKTEE